MSVESMCAVSENEVSVCLCVQFTRTLHAFSTVTLAGLKNLVRYTEDIDIKIWFGWGMVGPVQFRLVRGGGVV